MRYFIPLILLLAACTQDCEDYGYGECPDTCGLCTGAMHLSVLECHSKEFCEHVSECSFHNISDCADGCAVCPPCAECSSISCQAEEYCESIGFDKGWYDTVKPK